MSGSPEAEPASDRERAFDALALTAVWEHDITGSGLGNNPSTTKTTTHTLALKTTSTYSQCEACGLEWPLPCVMQEERVCYRSAAVTESGWAQTGERWLVEEALQLGCADWVGPGWFPLLQLRSTQANKVIHFMQVKNKLNIKQTDRQTMFSLTSAGIYACG